MHNIFELSKHYLTHLLLDGSPDLFSDGLYELTLYGDLQLLLHNGFHLFRYGLSLTCPISQTSVMASGTCAMRSSRDSHTSAMAHRIALN